MHTIEAPPQETHKYHMEKRLNSRNEMDQSEVLITTIESQSLAAAEKNPSASFAVSTPEQPGRPLHRSFALQAPTPESITGNYLDLVLSTAEVQELVKRGRSQRGAPWPATERKSRGPPGETTHDDASQKKLADDHKTSTEASTPVMGSEMALQAQILLSLKRSKSRKKADLPLKQQQSSPLPPPRRDDDSSTVSESSDSFVSPNRNKKKQQCDSDTMKQAATTTWPVKPASSASETNGTNGRVKSNRLEPSQLSKKKEKPNRDVLEPKKAESTASPEVTPTKRKSNKQAREVEETITLSASRQNPDRYPASLKRKGDTLNSHKTTPTTNPEVTQKKKAPKERRSGDKCQQEPNATPRENPGRSSSHLKPRGKTKKPSKVIRTTPEIAQKKKPDRRSEDKSQQEPNAENLVKTKDPLKASNGLSKNKTTEKERPETVLPKADTHREQKRKGTPDREARMAQPQSVLLTASESPPRKEANATSDIPKQHRFSRPEGRQLEIGTSSPSPPSAKKTRSSHPQSTLITATQKKKQSTPSPKRSSPSSSAVATTAPKRERVCRLETHSTGSARVGGSSRKARNASTDGSPELQNKRKGRSMGGSPEETEERPQPQLLNEQVNIESSAPLLLTKSVQGKTETAHQSSKKSDSNKKLKEAKSESITTKTPTTRKKQKLLHESTPLSSKSEQQQGATAREPSKKIHANKKSKETENESSTKRKKQKPLHDGEDLAPANEPSETVEPKQTPGTTRRQPSKKRDANKNLKEIESESTTTTPKTARKKQEPLPGYLTPATKPSEPMEAKQSTATKAAGELVWVKQGKAEHAARLMEHMGDDDKTQVLVKWETLGTTQKVDVSTIRTELSRRSRGRAGAYTESSRSRVRKKRRGTSSG